MFTTGQLVFTLIFFILFAVVIAFSYRGDKKVHKKYYKNNAIVLAIFVVFVLIILALRFLVGN